LQLFGSRSTADKSVFIRQTLIDSILSYAKGVYPKEGILLLRGKIKKDFILVDENVIPPFANHGEDFSSFPLFPLPLDASIVGVAHSHPSGILSPSVEDLNNFYGRVMVIVAYPYRSSRDLAIFNSEGKKVTYRII
jgi:proteasome lid subunit RPN8/RPN11